MVDQKIHEGLLLFNQKQFWQCHESLEQVWKTRVGDEKLVLASIIQIAAALFQSERGQMDRANRMLEKAVSKIKLVNVSTVISQDQWDQFASHIFRCLEIEDPVLKYEHISRWRFEIGDKPS